MKYIDTVTINRDEMTLASLDDFLEDLRGPGSAEFVEEAPGRIIGVKFEVEADDLWDLHEQAEEVESIIEVHAGHYVISRDKVVEE